MTTYQYITVAYGYEDRIATVTLRRPAVNNAMNNQLIQVLTTVFMTLNSD